MATKIIRGDGCFPDDKLSFDGAPDALWCEGNLDLLKTKGVAVIGSRKCTAYGKTVAKTIGKRLGESGVTVISGLAAGIDACGHRGCLEAGGNTIAVLGCGTDIFYPSENRELQKKIIEKGLLVSEYPPGTIANAFHFPLRNRIISGLSESVVVVEAANRSGALITAEAAAEQGRDVYAVPGNITSFSSFGTNKLIRDGVNALILIDDLITDIGMKPYNNEEILNLGNDEKKVFQAICRRGEISAEDICFATNMKPSLVSGIITILEMKGLIFSSMGKIFVAKF